MRVDREAGISPWLAAGVFAPTAVLLWLSDWGSSLSTQPAEAPPSRTVTVGVVLAGACAMC